MRGKKSDPEFISQYISNCINLGFSSAECILALAQGDIKKIDDEIKKVEELKVKRGKLLDVIAKFDKHKKETSQEAKILDLFNLEYPEICARICLNIKRGPITLNGVQGGGLDSESKFCIKQLIERKILSRQGNFISGGDRFYDYIKYVLHEEV